MKYDTNQFRTFFLGIGIFIIMMTGFLDKGLAQQVAVQVSYDTVYAGNSLMVKFSMEDWQGDMVDPDFGDFKVAGGPQMTSSMSYSRGERKVYKSIIFYLIPPEDPGTYLLPSILFKDDESEFSTPEIPVVVVENPDGIEQNPVIGNDRPYAFDKKMEKRAPTRGQRQRF